MSDIAITRATYFFPKEGNRLDFRGGDIYGVYEQLKKDAQAKIEMSGGARVQISAVAKTLNLLFEEAARNASSTVAGFDAFLSASHEAILEKGSAADLFKEEPNTFDPIRASLSKQAANYLSVSLYGGEKIEEQTSAENPFAKVDRLFLSMIAFNDNGLFTKAERLAAFFEMRERDTQFGDQVEELTMTKERADEKAPWREIMTALQNATLASGMSNAELSWRGMDKAEDFAARADLLLKQTEREKPTLPAYQNLKSDEDTLLIAAKNAKGEAAWQMLSVDQLTPENIRLALLASISKELKTGQLDDLFLKKEPIKQTVFSQKFI